MASAIWTMTFSGRGRLHVVVVGADRVDDARVLVELAHQLHADLGVVLVAVGLDALADVVQEGAALGDLPVGADLGGEHAGDDRHFLGVRQDVLPVAGPVMEAAQGLDEVGRHVVDAEVEDDLLPLLVDLLGDFPSDPFWTISMRAGWTRPSAMRRSSETRAISRRTGSKQEMTTSKYRR